MFDNNKLSTPLYLRSYESEDINKVILLISQIIRFYKYTRQNENSQEKTKSDKNNIN